MSEWKLVDDALPTNKRAVLVLARVYREPSLEEDDEGGYANHVLTARFFMTHRSPERWWFLSVPSNKTGVVAIHSVLAWMEMPEFEDE
jgi:hypothetical protein